MPDPRTSEVRCYVAFGSNLGDREARLCAARGDLDATPGLVLRAASSLYETAPVGPGVQRSYLNAVVSLACRLSARALLERLLEIERAHGRRRDVERVRWGPRSLDLDLLLFGEACIDEPGLVVPHPRMHERAFVLEPLCEIADTLLHPRHRERIVIYRDAHRNAAAVWRHEPVRGWRSGRVLDRAPDTI